ncbi:hypothetical protein [Faecalimicrobium dakarense]|uniref:hypothetical protein n=1 Tax=Faecalimicrobium dakarense TaxID=1301100 RepID=UPI0004B6DE24|nr:hypothetical protein [[Clostridium] dakarense]
MRFTEKYKNWGILFAIVLLNTIDSAFFPNTTFSLYKLVANIFLIFILVRFIGGTFSDFKSDGLANTLSLKSILTYLFILALWLLMFININF